jgi:protein involved in polysaccharide export with SLBB domain
MGQVRSPGPQEIPADEAYTVSKAILRAGGFGPYADKKKVKLIRGGKSGASSKPVFINCIDILDKGQWEKDVEISPEDIITVPEKWINIF